MRTEGVWLVTYKKASGKATFGYDEAVEEALCFGWIDGKANALDEARSMQWYAQRKPASGWSRINKRRIETLEASGRLHAAGRAKIEAAKEDGSWNALDAFEDLVVPDDLVQALARHRDAARHFDAFPRSVKRGLLGWIGSAKRPETRQARIEEIARLASKNRRANQW